MVESRYIYIITGMNAAICRGLPFCCINAGCVESLVLPLKRAVGLQSLKCVSVSFSLSLSLSFSLRRSLSVCLNTEGKSTLIMGKAREYICEWRGGGNCGVEGKAKSRG